MTVARGHFISFSSSRSTSPCPHPQNDGYSTCHYTEDSYYQAFAKVAPAIKKAFPGIKIHANSAVGQAGCARHECTSGAHVSLSLSIFARDPCFFYSNAAHAMRTTTFFVSFCHNATHVIASMTSFCCHRVHDLLFTLRRFIFIKSIPIRILFSLRRDSCCFSQWRHRHTAEQTSLTCILLTPPAPAAPCHDSRCRQIREDAATAALVDAWTWHYVGRDSDSVIDDLDELTNNTLGKPVFNNECVAAPCAACTLCLAAKAAPFSLPTHSPPFLPTRQVRVPAKLAI